ncbi:MAG: DUF3352 domain-containing protein, partial [Bacteroidales bacterium]
MSKRIIIPGIILVLAISIIIGFIFIRKKSVHTSNPWKVIPVDAVYILRINNYHSFTSSLKDESKIWQNISSIKPFEYVNDNILYIDSLAHTNSRLSELIRKSRIHISGHYIGGRKSNVLFTISVAPGQNEKSIVDVISDVTGQDLRRKERKYEGEAIYTIHATNNGENRNYYLSPLDGNIVISRSVILIENAIRQQSLSRSLLDDTEFSEALFTSGKNKEANLFVNLEEITGIASIIANDRFGVKLKKYEHFGEWAEFDVNIIENQAMLNGFLMSNVSGDKFTDIFSDVDPVKITVYKVLPASVSTFLSFGISDIKRIEKSFQDYLVKTGGTNERNNALNEVSDVYQINLEQVFSGIIDDEITMAYGGFTERSLNIPARYVLVKCKSGSQAKKEIESIAARISRKKGISSGSLKHTYSVDNDLSFEILRFPLVNFTGMLFGEAFALGEQNYLTFYENYLIVSESIEGLQHLLYNNLLNKTLETNSPFRNFTNGIDQKSYFLFYTNLSRSSTMFSEYLSENVIKTWEEKFEVFQNIQALGFQITEVSNLRYGNLVIQHMEEYKGKPQTVWESLLDTAFTMKPKLVTNHYTKQKEIFLQDLNNTIYLINKAGRILWKQKISEQIISDIFQIDYYKNGKLQLLFCTENYLHLIDRFGNYVERYPVRLRAEASAGMSLFDYENNKNYRIFVPCVDNHIYAYSKDGNLISGWDFQGSDYPVRSELSHFRVYDKDFIVAGDKYKIWILDRRGNVRVPVEETITKSENNKFYVEISNTVESSRIVTTDTAGTILSIYFDGKVEHTSIEVFGPEHFFDFKDVDADGRKDYIFLDHGNLKIYSRNRTEILHVEFPSTIHERPIYFRFSSADRKLGLTDPVEDKIYLVNNDGSIYKGFPLEGTTLFSIGNLEST